MVGMIQSMKQAMLSAQANNTAPTQSPCAEIIAEHGGKGATHAEVGSALGNVLGLPRGYRAESGNDVDDANVEAMTAQLSMNPTTTKQLSDAANEGMEAARDGNSAAAVATRCASDPAFKAGYDAYQWAEHNSPSDLAALNQRIAPPPTLPSLSTPMASMHAMRG